METRLLSPDLDHRFFAKVHFTDECWIWTGKRIPAGYGRISIGNVGFYVHRIMHLAAIGPIPAGYQIDHLCRNTSCVRPDHLEAVTPRENVMRSLSMTVLLHMSPKCMRGHDKSIHGGTKKDGRFNCRKCDAIAHQRRSDLKRAALGAKAE